MSEIINLKQQRKAKARTEKDKKAAENRIVYGQTKAQKQLKKTETDKASRHLDLHKRETDEE